MGTVYDLTDNYDKWRHRFEATYERIQSIYAFSPGWLQEWDAVWQQYDTMEAVRNARGKDKQPWQAEKENTRREWEALRPQATSTLTAEDWLHCPLGACVERFLDAEIPRKITDWATALENFNTFRDLVLENNSENGFEKSLSKSQRVSWSLLMDWWNGSYQDIGLSRSARESIQVAASLPCRIGIDELQPEPERSGKTVESLYHSYMFRLFRKEFYPVAWEPHLKNIYLLSLRYARSRALSAASSQRIGFAAWTMRLGNGNTLPPKICSTPYIGSIIEPCPWLQKSSKKDGRPFYLWDIWRSQTIETNRLDYNPEYACISHTWGRWLKRDQPPLSIPGVPWLVPQNEKFNVKDLPMHFLRLQLTVSFVWFDLFCIPQDGSLKANEEISRQSSIFQQSSVCMAWINDANSWEGVTRSTNWLGISYLENTTRPGHYNTEGMKDEFRKEADQFSELLQGSRMLQSHEHDHLVDINSGSRPTVWFSSLWTLQEAALCPDLLLVDRDWRPLTDAMKISVGLSALLDFIDTVANTWMEGRRPNSSQLSDPIAHQNSLRLSPEWDSGAYERWPTGAQQLRQLSIITRLDKELRTPSPTGLLVMANLRQCSGERAPAIMSALGVTDWYSSELKRKSKSPYQPLVLETYPLAFVQEAARKLGAEFYGCLGVQARKIPGEWNARTLPAVGSMLPFVADKSLYSGYAGVPEHSKLNPVDHPSVKTWIIMADGSLRIKSAGIVAAKGNRQNRKYVASILIMHEDGNFNSIPRTVDLDEWIQTLSNGQCAYAVSLYEDANYQHGILLQGSKAFLSSKNWLVKTGVFFSHNQKTAPAEQVHWKVL
jgi:Heterokaryon incompatibility protein (HET)